MATVTVRYIVDDVDDVDASVDFYCRNLGFQELMHPAATFALLVRNDIVTGAGGRQVLLEDPSGNPVQLFEPVRPKDPAASPP